VLTDTANGNEANADDVINLNINHEDLFEDEIQGSATTAAVGAEASDNSQESNCEEEPENNELNPISGSVASTTGLDNVR